ncbi:hypothetical protein FH5_02456 [Priestia endophytica]|nr:hypothetical protein FH5_02456 [Priestia endophytica]
MDSYILKRAHASQYRLELTNSPELAHIDKTLWRPPWREKRSLSLLGPIKSLLNLLPLE